MVPAAVVAALPATVVVTAAALLAARSPPQPPWRPRPTPYEQDPKYKLAEILRRKLMQDNYDYSTLPDLSLPHASQPPPPPIPDRPQPHPPQQQYPPHLVPYPPSHHPQPLPQPPPPRSIESDPNRVTPFDREYMKKVMPVNVGRHYVTYQPPKETTRWIDRRDLRDDRPPEGEPPLPWEPGGSQPHHPDAWPGPDQYEPSYDDRNEIDRRNDYDDPRDGRNDGVPGPPAPASLPPAAGMGGPVRARGPLPAADDLLYYMSDSHLAAHSAPAAPSAPAPREPADPSFQAFHPDTAEYDTRRRVQPPRQYKVLQQKRMSGRRSAGGAGGGGARRFVQEEGAGGVAIAAVDRRHLFPEFRLPAARRQYKHYDDLTDADRGGALSDLTHYE